MWGGDLILIQRDTIARIADTPSNSTHTDTHTPFGRLTHRETYIYVLPSNKHLRWHAFFHTSQLPKPVIYSM